MQLKDQFTSDGTLHLRSFRNLLDTISACENMPLALVSRNVGEDHLRVSSFSAPLFELLRTRNWFREYERGLIEAAVEKRVADPNSMPTAISYHSRLDGLVIAYLIPTPEPSAFIMCGPVWLRNSVTLREPFTQRFVERLAEEIAEADGRFPENRNEHRLSIDRVRRVLQHRAAVSETDLLERVDQVNRTVQSIFEGHVPHNLTADQIENVALAICFWNRRRELLPRDPGGRRLAGNIDAMPPDEGLIFVLDGSIGDEKPLAFELVLGSTSDTGNSLFATPLIAKAWSFFSDTYRSNRNLFFLERILLIRLWLQDNFSGIAASDETGGIESRRLLNELMRRLQRILGADACILYQYLPGETSNGPADTAVKAGYLRRLAYHYVGDTGLEKASKNEAKRMETIGANPADRKRSISYRAIDDKQTIYDPDATAEDVYLAEGSQPPQTILSTPLVSRGCAWGVIEIFGCDKHQFPYSNIRWIEELSRILTPILFDHWATYRLREISRIAMSETSPDETSKYAQVLDHIRKLLMASSARLYLQNSNQTTHFAMKTHVGQDWPAGAAPSFNLDEPNSVSAQAIVSQSTWMAGIIGKEPFDESGPKKPLEMAGCIGCAVVPIYNGSGNCFATLMVTSTDNVFQMSMWDSTVSAISKNLNVVLEAIHLQDTRVEARQTYFAHTIKTRTIRVERGGQRLLKELEPLLGDPNLMSHIQQFANEIEALASLAVRHSGRALSGRSVEVLRALRATFPAPSSTEAHRVHGLAQLVGDLREHLSELRKSAVFIAGGPNEENPSEANPETWDGTWADLRLSLLASLKPVQDEGPRTNIRAPERSVLPVGVKVRLPHPILTELLNNLIDNAIKYDFSPPSSNLRVRADPSQRRFTLEFRNMAPNVSPEEARRLRSNSRYRAEYARRRNRDGSGVGLRFIRELAVAWHFEFDYDIPVSESAEEVGKMGWHSLKLTFNTASEN